MDGPNKVMDFIANLVLEVGLNVKFGAFSIMQAECCCIMHQFSIKTQTHNHVF